MNKSIGSIGKVLATLFVMLLTSLVILMIFGVINLDTLKESAGKIGGAFVVLLIATAVISWVQNVNEK